MEGGFPLEMHVHSSEMSTCAKATRNEMIDYLIRHGVKGCLFADHFWRGNCVAKNLPFKEKINLYRQIQKSTEEYAKRVGFSVYFAFELTSKKTDFLVLGIDCDFLMAHPELEDMEAPEIFDVFHEAGGFVIHAHPYRPKQILLYPYAVDAVEIINAHNKMPYMDEMAKLYAKSYNLATACGSDYHADREHCLAVMNYKRKPESVQEIIEMIKNGEYEMKIIPPEV